MKKNDNDRKLIAKAKKVKKLNDSVDINVSIKQMEKMVDDKLQSMKFFVPFVLTIVTSLLAYLFTTTSNAFDDYIYIIVAYLLLCLASIFLAYAPHNSYNENINDADRIKKNKRTLDLYPEIEIWNLDSYINLSDVSFLARLEKLAQRKLSQDELASAQFLKQKINEYRHKKGVISIAYIVIIVGAFVLAIFIVTYFLYAIRGKI